MCIRICLYSLIECLEDQRIVIPVSHHIGNDSTVIEVQDRTEIDFVDFNAFIPLEFGNICEPFLIRLVRVKVSVQDILGYELGIIRLFCTTVVAVLYGGLDALDAADPEDALVVHVDVFIVSEIVIDAAVALVRALHVDLLNLLGNPHILRLSAAQLAGCPLVVRRPRYTQHPASFING